MFFDEKDNPQSKGESTVSVPSIAGAAQPSKVSLKDLPPGVKVGDVVKLKIKSLDEATNCAYVVSDGSMDEGAGEEKPEVEEPGDTPEAEENEAPAGGMSQGLLTGPMGKLKNYLAQKSVDHQSQI